MIRRRRRTGQPFGPGQLKQTSHAVLDTLGALVPRASEVPPSSRISHPGGRARGPYVRPGPAGLAVIRRAPGQPGRT